VTDRQTDRIAMAKDAMKAVAAFTRKKLYAENNAEGIKVTDTEYRQNPYKNPPMPKPPPCSMLFFPCYLYFSKIKRFPLNFGCVSWSHGLALKGAHTDLICH